MESLPYKSEHKPQSLSASKTPSQAHSSETPRHISGCHYSHWTARLRRNLTGPRRRR